MRWKTLVDCYHRHEALKGILCSGKCAVSSQTQRDETDSRLGCYLPRPETRAGSSERYIRHTDPYLCGY